MKHRPVDRSNQVRVIVDSRDYTKDYWENKQVAEDQYNQGLLAIDLTNSKPHERVYTKM